MYERINYTAVGIFVIVFTILASYFAFWLAKGDITEDKFNIYYTYFSESVDGLNKDSVVKLNGVDVGRLKSLNIDSKNPSKIVATLFIDKNVKITKDMYAVLKSQGLTGLRYINIIGGTSSEFIKPNTKNSIIKSKESFMNKLLDDTPALVDKITTFSKRLNLLLNDENLNNFNEILKNSRKITDKTLKLEDKINSIVNDFNNTKINNFIKEINTTIYEYKQVAKSGNKTLKILNKKLPSLLSSIEKSSNKLTKTLTLVDKTIKRGDYNLKRALEPAIVDLKELSISYIELSNELKSLIQNPAQKLLDGTKVPKGPGE
jgi:phospholipid/cholesterol/gamma-HCH transport system substrate-binding protein